VSGVDAIIDELEKMGEEGRYADILEKLRLSAGFDQLLKIYWSLYAYKNVGMVADGIQFYEINRKNVENDNRDGIKTKIWNMIGTLYYDKGATLTAYEFFQRAFESAIRSNDTMELSQALNNLGMVTVARGDLAKGLEYYEKCLEQALKTKNIGFQSSIIFNIAQIHYLTKDYDQAREYYLQSLDLRRQMSNPSNIARILKNLVELEFEQTPDMTKIGEYIEELQGIANTQNTEKTMLYYIYCKAFLSRSEKDYFKAEHIFRKVIDGNQETDITINAILHLIELLFMSYKEDQKEQTLVDIHTYLDKMFDISASQYSFRYLVKSLLLKSQLTAIEGDFEESFLLIERALQSTEDHNMGYLRKEIIRQKESLTSEYEKLKEMFSNDSSLLTRLTTSSIMELIRD
jgi:tetratricopeptide (TPR) repeat protein